MKKKLALKSFLVFSLIFSAKFSFAQIDFGGSLDLEFSVGGKDSQWIVNEVNNDFREPHLSISQFNLFGSAWIDENFSVNTRMQFDTWGSGKLNNLRLSLVSLDWNSSKLPLSASVGRFVTPFGLYPRRQLSISNPLVSMPLAYGYFVNVTPKLGLWRIAGNSGDYGENSHVGLSTIYYGGYTTGASFNWTILEEKMNLEVAALNAAISASEAYLNNTNYGFAGRLGLQPKMWWQQGFSFGYGSFMQADTLNDLGFDYNDDYQMTLGTDWILSYSYFEFSGEVIYSKWKVPSYRRGIFVTEGGEKLIEFELENYAFYTDLKFEPPFLSGSFISARFEKLIFSKFDNYSTPDDRIVTQERIDSGIVTKQKETWDNDVTRYAIGFGYKLSRSVLLKVAYSDQNIKNVDSETYSFRAILTTMF